MDISELATMEAPKGAETKLKKNTTVSISVQLIKDFKGDRLSLSAFIDIYGRKYLNGEL